MRSKSKRRRKLWVPKVSKLEHEVFAALKGLRYKIERQVPIYSTTGRLRGVFDFFLTAHNVALEVNGTYWHSDPRVYPNGPQTKSQRKAMRSWKKKLRYADLRGIRIIVIWEQDFVAAPDKKLFLRQLIKDQL